MKILFIFILSLSMAHAGELKSEVYETKSGFGFYFYQLSPPEEGSALWEIITLMRLPQTWHSPSLVKKFETTDKSFGFVCKQLLETKNVYESSCTFSVKEAVLENKTLSFVLKGQAAREFSEILAEGDFYLDLLSKLQVRRFSDSVEFVVRE